MLFVIVHVFEVIVTGFWNNLRSMITGYCHTPWNRRSFSRDSRRERGLLGRPGIRVVCRHLSSPDKVRNTGRARSTGYPPSFWKSSIPENAPKAWLGVNDNQKEGPGNLFLGRLTICYLSSVSDTSKKPRSDFHMFTWDMWFQAHQWFPEIKSTHFQLYWCDSPLLAWLSPIFSR